MELVQAYVDWRSDRIRKILDIARQTIALAMDHFEGLPNTLESRKQMQNQINFALEKLEKDHLPPNRFIVVEIQETASEGSTVKIDPFFTDSKGSKIPFNQVVEEVLSIEYTQSQRHNPNIPFFRGYKHQSPWFATSSHVLEEEVMPWK